ncbi:MAG: hypothetical protein M1820_003857 [Bogoriella megaspora]|nr:MAG: hypothetical protein M1820_003857 [Bogoriella megaspora]
MPPKTIHLVRHAQGYHNLTPTNHSMPDPTLTPFGESQCQSLSTTFPHPPSPTSFLTVSSPLKRTLTTTLLTFPSISPTHPILAYHLFQETSSLPCDIASPLSKLKKEYAGKSIDFSLLEEEERERGSEGWRTKMGKWGTSKGALERRAREAREWLWRRGEEEVVVVTHGGFLHWLTGSWEGYDRSTGLGTGWQNTEFRTYSFRDESAPGPEYEIVETEESRKRRDSEKVRAEEMEMRRVKKLDGGRKDEWKRGVEVQSKVRAISRERDFVGGY